jgi:hypothetical protein
LLFRPESRSVYVCARDLAVVDLGVVGLPPARPSTIVSVLHRLRSPLLRARVLRAARPNRRVRVFVVPFRVSVIALASCQHIFGHNANFRQMDRVHRPDPPRPDDSFLRSGGPPVLVWSSERPQAPRGPAGHTALACALARDERRPGLSLLAARPSAQRSLCWPAEFARWSTHLARRGRCAGRAPTRPAAASRAQLRRDPNFGRPLRPIGVAPLGPTWLCHVAMVRCCTRQRQNRRLGGPRGPEALHGGPGGWRAETGSAPAGSCSRPPGPSCCFSPTHTCIGAPRRRARSARPASSAP